MQYLSSLVASMFELTGTLSKWQWIITKYVFSKISVVNNKIAHQLLTSKIIPSRPQGNALPNTYPGHVPSQMRNGYPEVLGTCVSPQSAESSESPHSQASTGLHVQTGNVRLPVNQGTHAAGATTLPKEALSNHEPHSSAFLPQQYIFNDLTNTGMPAPNPVVCDQKLRRVQSGENNVPTWRQNNQ